MGWVLAGDDDRLPDLWPGAADLAPAAAEMVLDAARQDCLDFAPALTDPDDPPVRYVLAQIHHARALTRAGFVGSNDQGGGYGEGVTVFPMDWHVKALLRPKRKPNPR